MRTVIQTIQLGVPIARCELLDALTIKAVNGYSKLGLREAPMLFCEFHGSAASVKEQAQTVQAIAKEQGGMDFEWATQQEDRTRLWQARHDAYPACLRLKPGGRAMSTDVCVPISKLAECIAETNKDLEGTTIPIALFGHVGDGNFHLAIVVDPNNPADLAEAERVNHNVVASRTLHGRHLHRRARHRLWQAGFSGCRARRGGSGDAGNQGVAGSA